MNDTSSEQECLQTFSLSSRIIFFNLELEHTMRYSEAFSILHSSNLKFSYLHVRVAL